MPTSDAPDKTVITSLDGLGEAIRDSELFKTTRIAQKDGSVIWRCDPRPARPARARPASPASVRPRAGRAARPAQNNRTRGGRRSSSSRAGSRGDPDDGESEPASGWRHNPAVVSGHTGVRS